MALFELRRFCRSGKRSVWPTCLNLWYFFGKFYAFAFDDDSCRSFARSCSSCISGRTTGLELPTLSLFSGDLGKPDTLFKPPVCDGRLEHGRPKASETSRDQRCRGVVVCYGKGGKATYSVDSQGCCQREEMATIYAECSSHGPAGRSVYS